MADPGGLTAPSLADIDALARAALAALPPPVAKAVQGVLLRVADFADDDTLADLELEDPFELTGLYDGVALTEASVMDTPRGPDTIWLYRRPILDEWAERGDVSLADLVTHVLVHEIAHHFGYGDAEIAVIDDWRL